MGSSPSCWFRLLWYSVVGYQFGQRMHSFSGGYFVKGPFYPGEFIEKDRFYYISCVGIMCK